MILRNAYDAVLDNEVISPRSAQVKGVALGWLALLLVGACEMWAGSSW